MKYSNISLWKENELELGPAPGEWIAGIDFGTTSSSSSLWIESKGRAKLIRGKGGRKITSSTVTFGEDFYDIYIGLDPLQSWNFSHGGIITSLKNLLGLNELPTVDPISRNEDNKDDKILSRIHSSIGTYIYAYSKLNKKEKKIAIEVCDGKQNKRAFLPEQLVALIMLSLRYDLLSYLNREIEKDEKKEEYNEENSFDYKSYKLKLDKHLNQIEEIFSYSNNFIFSNTLVEDYTYLTKKDIINYSPIKAPVQPIISNNHSQKKFSLTNVVLGTPVIFSDSQRISLKIAATLAGFRSSVDLPSSPSLTNISLFPESTAAAVSFGLLVSGEKKVMVVDIGGGTTDITLIDINPENSKIILTEGNRFLGGQDFDLVLMKFIKLKLILLMKENAQENFNSRNWKFKWDDHLLSEEDLKRNEVQWRLLNKCRECKEMLSKEESYTVSISSSIFNKIGKISSNNSENEENLIKILVTRKDFEEHSSSILKVFNATISKALTNLKNLSDKDINNIIHEVVLVGGTSRIPCIRKALLKSLEDFVINRFYIPNNNEQNTSGKVEFCTSINPEEIVCEGLAIRGAILMALAYRKTKIQKQEDKFAAPIVDVSRLRWLHAIDCVPNTIGVLASELDGETGKFIKYFDPILEKGKSYPTIASKRFKCNDSSQKFVTIELYEEVEDVISLEKENTSYNLIVTRDILIERLEFYHKKFAKENIQKFYSKDSESHTIENNSKDLYVDIIIGLDEDGAIHYRAIEAIPYFSLDFSLYLIEFNFNRCLLTPLELGYTEDLKELDRINRDKDLKFIVYILVLFILYVIFKIQFANVLQYNTDLQSDKEL